MYGGSVHTELVPQERDGIRGELVRLTAEIEAFNSEVWREKRERGVSLSQPIKGVSIPGSLTAFEEDLRKMHRLA